jgi:apolipoprotein N-acyltransferase
MSQFKTIRDTSGFAAKAVEDLFSEGSTIAAFRYQARLGVGKHFTQFFWLLLPFYVNLKFWFYLLSVFVGFVIGQLFIFIVFKCRERFKRRRRSVAIGASAVVAIGSAIAFTRGVEIVNIGWVRSPVFSFPCFEISH